MPGFIPGQTGLMGVVAGGRKGREVSNTGLGGLGYEKAVHLLGASGLALSSVGAMVRYGPLPPRVVPVAAVLRTAGAGTLWDVLEEAVPQVLFLAGIGRCQNKIQDQAPNLVGPELFVVLGPTRRRTQPQGPHLGPPL